MAKKTGPKKRVETDGKNAALMNEGLDSNLLISHVFLRAVRFIGVEGVRNSHIFFQEHRFGPILRTPASAKKSWFLCLVWWRWLGVAWCAAEILGAAENGMEPGVIPVKNGLNIQKWQKSPGLPKK